MPSNASIAADESSHHPEGPRVLATKLYPPRMRAEALPRPRLIAALNSGLERKMTLITGQAGYGKSTLALQWLAQADRPVAWVSLDESDDEPMSFFLHLVAALQRIEAGFAQETRMLLEGPTVATQTIVRTLINDLAPATRPFALILDDFHHIKSPSVLEGLVALLRNLPNSMHLILLSRIDPELPLTRMEARGELSEFRDLDLRFTIDESIALLEAQPGITLSRSQVEVVDRLIEGWPAGLQLFSHAVENRSPESVRRFIDHLTEAPSEIDQYLLSEVIDRQAPEVRDFLLLTSILDRLSADAGDAVAEQSNARDILAFLEKTHLFLLRLDDTGEWYRLHHLFRSALLRRLDQESTEPEIRQLHNRAAQWFEQHDLLEEAISHAILSQNWDLALDLLHRIGSDFRVLDRLLPMRQWLQQVPLEVLERDPSLCSLLAWSRAAYGQLALAMAPLAAAEKSFTATNDQESLAAVQAIRVLQQVVQMPPSVAIATATRALAFLPEAHQAERAAIIDLLGFAYLLDGQPREAEKYLRSGRADGSELRQVWLRMAELNFSGWLLVDLGRLHDAAVVLREALSVGDPWVHQGVPFARLQLGAIELEWNRLDSATGQLMLALELSERMKSQMHLTSIYREQSKVLRAQGDMAAALIAANRAIDAAVDIASPWFQRAAETVRAKLWLATGNVELVRQWIEANGFDHMVPGDHSRSREFLVHAAVKVQEGEPHGAIEVLETVSRTAEAAGAVKDLIEVSVLRAHAWESMHEREKSVESLEHALELGEPGGFARTFLWETEWIEEPLRHIVRRGRHREYARRLLSSLHTQPRADGKVNAVPFSELSERELEVLKLLASGQSNFDIGRTLFISELTVKKHVSNILGKFGAANRTQAVDMARRHGTLTDL